MYYFYFIKLYKLYKNICHHIYNNMLEEVFHYSITGLYLTLCFFSYYFPYKVPKIDKDKIKNFCLFHNLFLITWNSYIFLNICYNVYDKKLTFFGNEPNDTSNILLNRLMYHFWISKYYDYVDTAIIILKGNYHQMSFLHVFHHSSVSTIMYYNYKLIPYGGDIWFLIFYNSFIHVILYYYYLITSLKTNTVVWWSKYLTTFQIIQFVCGNVQQIGSIIVNKNYPQYIREINTLYSTYMLYLFVSFYIKRYNKNKKIV